MTTIQADDFPIEPLSRRGLVRALLKGWWLVVVLALLGSAVGFFRASRAAVVYEADAVVVATQTPISVDNFGSLARAAFNTETVIQPVIDELGLDTTPRALLAKGELQATALPGAVAVRIFGRASNPQLASQLANAGARSFIQAAQESGMGRFALFGSGPGVRLSSGTSLSTVQGTVAGALLGVFALIVLYLWRKPVYGLQEAEREVKPDASFAARVRAPSARVPWGSRARGNVYPRSVVPAIWREVARLGGGIETTCAFVLVGKGGVGATLPTFLEEMTEAYWDAVGRPRRPFTWARSDAPELPPALEEARVAVAVVAEGVPRSALRALDEELRLAPLVKARILVLLT